MRFTAQQIHRYVQKSQRIVIVPHQNPDGDAIGSATAVYEYLLQLNKSAVIFCVTPANSKLHFLPYAVDIETDPSVLCDQKVDLIIVLDSGDLRYAGIAELVKDHPATIICIDHHATNEHYGHLNLVDVTASSTCEIIYHYFHHNHIAINQKMATALLTGLTTDTGNFTNAATSALALNVGGELIRSGGNLNLVTDATTRNKSVSTLRLWGKVLSRLTKDEATGITHTYITKEDFVEHGVSEAEGEGIANFLNNLENNRVALILKEMPGGIVKGSFRTTRDDVDVSALAKRLNGGGHKKAAGFSLEGTIDEVLQKILTMER